MKKNKTSNAVRWMPWAMLLVILLTASCKDHYWEGRSQMGMFMQWDDPYDDTTAVSGVHMWIFQKDGTYVMEYDQPSRSHMVHWPEPIAPGEYLVVATLNLTEPFIATISNTRAQMNVRPSAEQLLFQLDKNESAPFHAFYGVTRVNLNTRRLPVALKMHRLLAELQFSIEGLPDGTIATGTVDNTTVGFRPALLNSKGSYGLAETQALAAPLPTVTSMNGTLTMPTMRFMPVKRGDNETLITLHLTFPDGTVSDYTMMAPIMESAGRYVVSLKYEEMHSPMYLTAHKINPWTEGWIITGEILNPNE